MTTTDLVPGRITSFRREQGFGVITLDDGTPVKFDSGICTMLPEEGAPVLLRTAPAKWGGGLKALHVEPAAAPGIVLAPPKRSLEDQLAVVQGEHLVSALTESILNELVAARFGGRPEAGTLVELLDAYYTGDPARARSDGYVRRAAGAADPDGLLAELAAILPNAKLPEQVRWTVRAPDAAPVAALELATVPYEKADDLDIEAALDKAVPEAVSPVAAAAALSSPTSAAPLGTLVVRDPDGRERSVEITSFDHAIELANAALRRAGDGHRVYRLDTGGGWHAYLALASDRALRLAAALPFSPAPDDIP
jgi:hypothetical protein